MQHWGPSGWRVQDNLCAMTRKPRAPHLHVDADLEPLCQRPRKVAERVRRVAQQVVALPLGEGA